MGRTTDVWFAKGYQSALADIAGKLVEDGEAGVTEWLLDNIRDDATRQAVASWRRLALGPTITTADGQTVAEGGRVFNYYDGEWGTVGRIDSGGWFDLIREDGSRGGCLNGERVCVRIPRGNPFFASHGAGNPS